MTRKEIIELLQVLRSAYPTAKITDPAGIVNLWEMQFGDCDTEEIYQAARHHMTGCKFFPTIADIRRSITKGKILYGSEVQEQNNANLVANTPTAPKIKIPADITFCDLCGLCDIQNQEYCPCDI